MSKVGVLVANGSRAKFIQFHGDSHLPALETLAEFSHPESRLKCSELASDKPGHYHANADSRGAFAAKHDPKENEKDHFALELAHELAHYRNEGFTRFILIMLPHFAGLVEKHLSKEVNALVWVTLHKDYIEWNDQALHPLIAEQLRPHIE